VGASERFCVVTGDVEATVPDLHSGPGPPGACLDSGALRHRSQSLPPGFRRT
jgi:hypothetical protein